MDFSNGKIISLEDKNLFDSYLKKFPPEISELTFTNLFIWRHHYDFEFLEWKNHLIIYSRRFLQSKWQKPKISGSNVFYMLPPIGSSPDLIISEVLNDFNQIEVHKVPTSIIEQIKESGISNDPKIEIQDDRNNWDYVYEINNLIELPGNKYRQNRRWLSKFLDNYKYKFEVITKDSINICRELQLEWCMMRGCEDDETLNEEQKAINEALNHFEILNYTGGLLCVEEKCVGYTFGEILNENTLVIHIEKAHMEYEGSYQAINNLFLQNCFAHVKFVNREQDLGIDSLRRAKESYKPHHMVEKSIIVKKE